MRIVFMGSAEIACEALGMLMEWSAVQVVGMISQPDRPGGRRLQMAACPAKAYAVTLGVEMATPDDVNSDASIEQIRAWEPDVGVVLAYGQILRKALLEIPRYGFINVHTSLLPRYRGAAPIQRAVANGDLETGVTVMQMETGMDTGEILAKVGVPIREMDTAKDLHDRLGVAGAKLLKEVLADLVAGRRQGVIQPSCGVTYAPRLQKAEGRIDWTQPARRLYNQVRGFYPWPCCHCLFQTGAERQMLRVLRSAPHPGQGGVPGEVLSVGRDLVVACGEGALMLLEVQPQSGAVMRGADFLRGRRLAPGDFMF